MYNKSCRAVTRAIYSIKIVLSTTHQFRTELLILDKLFYVAAHHVTLEITKVFFLIK